MRQGGPRERSHPIDLAVPVLAKVRKPRAIRPHHAVLLALGPALVRRITPDEAPEAARTEPCANRRPLVLRHDGAGFLRPLLDPRGEPVGPDGLPARIRAWASGEDTWEDWPYATAKRRPGIGRIPVLDPPFDKLAECSIDPATRHAEEAAAFAARFVLVGDVFHQECGEPCLDLVARSVNSGTPTSLNLVPSFGRHPDAATESCVLQTFAAAARDDALRYGTTLSNASGLRVWIGPGWEVAPGLAGRDDAREAPAEGLARIASLTASRAGHLPRPAAEAWLDLREAARSGPDAAEALDLCRRLADLLPAGEGRLRTLLEWNRLRWADPLPPDDAQALGTLA
jgi:hypothetical protein